MFLNLGCLNTEFRKLLLPVFSFQITLTSDTFINTTVRSWCNGYSQV